MCLNQTFKPCNELQPYVSAIYVLQSTAPVTLCIMPHTNCSLIFNFRGTVYLKDSNTYEKLPGSVIKGGFSGYQRCHIGPESGLIVVKFKACGITSFFDLSPADSFPGTRNLDKLVNPVELSAVERAIRMAGTNEERIAAIEQFLCNRMTKANQDILIMKAAGMIRAANGNLKIGTLSKSLYVSESQFEKRFRKAMGLSAKKYASLVRIARVMSDDLRDNNITDKAYEAGYFDQAHFIRDFKAYTGYTPLRFFKLQPQQRSFMPIGLIEPETREAYA